RLPTLFGPGDLIEIFRVGYKHWAVYIGSGYVVHFVVNGESFTHIISVLHLLTSEMGVVMKEKLQEVLKGDRWRINNYLDRTYKPQQIYAIVKQASGFIGARLPYNLVSFNCEHFANELRYGKRTSRQVVAEAGVIWCGEVFTGMISLLKAQLNTKKRYHFFFSLHMYFMSL
uniref:LRAT domain-containing protein n=1 Tax=Cyprinodon variegatus TaxID=28743 RepID=A0A3Q2DP44_CYPVA